LIPALFGQGLPGGDCGLYGVDLNGSNHYRCRNNDGSLVPTQEFQQAINGAPYSVAFRPSAGKKNSLLSARIWYVNSSLAPFIGTVNTNSVFYSNQGYGSHFVGSATVVALYIPPVSVLYRDIVLGTLPDRVDKGILLVGRPGTSAPLPFYIVNDAPPSLTIKPLPWSS
jgi:hypothetical protein